MDTTQENRKRLEAAFHDARERDRQTLSDADWDRKYSNKKWYSVTRRHRAYFDSLIAELVPGRVALDYCCGIGQTSLQLARAGARIVYGVDISPESVKTTAALLEENGFTDVSRIEVMDAENMAFGGDTFDVIICAGVLHHLDVNAAFPELARVLKPTGTIVCVEALGYNPLINLYRRKTPSIRTAWEAKHILTLRELEVARDSFAKISVRFFYLFSIIAAPFRRSRLFGVVLSVLEAVDWLVLRIPGVRRMAWQMVFTLAKPRNSGRR
jgi:SAM-dependent methyltransferase